MGILKPGLKHPRLLRKRLLESTFGQRAFSSSRSTSCMDVGRPGAPVRRGSGASNGHNRATSDLKTMRRHQRGPRLSTRAASKPPLQCSSSKIRVRPKMDFVAQDKVEVRVLERIVHTARCEIMTGNGFALPLAGADHLDVFRSEARQKIRVRAFPYGNVCRVEASLPPAVAIQCAAQ